MKLMRRGEEEVRMAMVKLEQGDLLTQRSKKDENELLLLLLL